MLSNKDTHGRMGYDYCSAEDSAPERVETYVPMDTYPQVTYTLNPHSEYALTINGEDFNPEYIIKVAQPYTWLKS